MIRTPNSHGKFSKSYCLDLNLNQMFDHLPLLLPSPKCWCGSVLFPNDSQVFCLLQGLILLFRMCFLLLQTFHFLSSFLHPNVHPALSIFPWLYPSSKLSTSSERVLFCLVSQKRNSLRIVHTRAKLRSQDGGLPHRSLERTKQTQFHREWKGLKYPPEIPSLNDCLSTYGIPGRWNSSKSWFLWRNFN